MKEPIQIAVYIACILIFIFALITYPKYWVDEKKVIEYRLGTHSNETIGKYPIIRAIIEDEGDEIISLPKYTVEEAIQLMDSLNSKLK